MTEKVVYILLTVGSAVGFGNVWRFPKLVEENGGASFVIIYIIGAILFAWPAVVLEVLIGQMSRGTAWDAGHATGSEAFILMGNQIMGPMMLSGYYTILISWSGMYLFRSFSQQWYPDQTDIDLCASSLYEGKGRNEAEWSAACQSPINAVSDTLQFCTYVPSGSDVIGTCITNSLTKGEYYFNHSQGCVPYGDSITVDGLNLGFSVPNVITDFNWPQFGNYSLALVTIYLSLSFGRRVLGWVMYVASTLPAVLLLVLLCYTATLDGASDGINQYIGKIDAAMFYDVDVWRAAIGQVIFSCSIGSYVMIGFAGSNSVDAVIGTNSAIIVLCDTVFAIIAGFVVYSLMGVVAITNNIEVSEAAGTGGAGMLFVVFSAGVSSITDNIGVTGTIHLFWWIVIFLIGWCTMLGYVENLGLTFSESILGDRVFPKSSVNQKKMYFYSFTIPAYVLLSIINVSSASHSVLDIIDGYAGKYILPLNALAGCVIFGHLFDMSTYIKQVGSIVAYGNVGLIALYSILAALARYFTDDNTIVGVIYFSFAIFVPLLTVPVMALFVDNDSFNYQQKCKAVWNGRLEMILIRTNETINHRSSHMLNGMLPSSFLDGLIRWLLTPFFAAMVVDTLLDYKTWVMLPGPNTTDLYVNTKCTIDGDCPFTVGPLQALDKYQLFIRGDMYHSCPNEYGTPEWKTCAEDFTLGQVIDCEMEDRVVISNVEYCQVERSYPIWLIVVGMGCVAVYFTAGAFFAFLPRFGKPMTRDGRELAIFKKDIYAFGYFKEHVDHTSSTPTVEKTSDSTSSSSSSSSSEGK